MATDFTEETAADAVVDSFAKTPDPRLRELLGSLVRHLVARLLAPHLPGSHPYPHHVALGHADHESRDQFFSSPVSIPVHVRYSRPDGILCRSVRGAARYAVKRFCM
jgi:hypothetical protein